MLLDHEGADQEAGSVEAVGAVDTHNVQWVLADVLPVYQETVLKCSTDPVPEVPPQPTLNLRSLLPADSYEGRHNIWVRRLTMALCVKNHLLVEKKLFGRFTLQGN